MPMAEIPLCVWRTRGQSFDFRGQSIRYWTAGQGEPLLLLHGFPTASWDWHYLWGPLAQRFRVIACDMLGFGDSAKPVDHVYSLMEQADLQQALLAELRVDQPVHLLAHDYGGSVAQNCWRGIMNSAPVLPAARSSTAGCSPKAAACC